MNFALALVSVWLGLLAACAAALAPLKAVVVSYPKDTPDSVLHDAQTAVVQAVRLCVSAGL